MSTSGVSGTCTSAADILTVAAVCSMQVEQAAEDVKRREAMLVQHEADLSRLEAVASSSQADVLKRDMDVRNRERGLAAQLAQVKAAEAQLQSKQLEAKELQVGSSDSPTI